jgi:hypothetical protein
MNQFDPGKASDYSSEVALGTDPQSSPLNETFNKERETLPEPTWDLYESLVLINKLIDAECTRLNVPTPKPLVIDQILFLKPWDFQAKWNCSPNIAGMTHFEETPRIDISDRSDNFNQLERIIEDEIDRALEELASSDTDSDQDLLDRAWEEAEKQFGECPEGEEGSYADKYVYDRLDELFLERDGYYLEMKRALSDKIDLLNRECRQHVLLHEALHVASKLAENQWGYSTYLPNERKIFESLNEAVTEKICHELSHERKLGREQLQELLDQYHELEYNDEFAITETVAELLPPSYEGDILVLDALIKRISLRQEVPNEMIWDRIKRGYFLGEKLHLAEIERVLEPGALRAYAFCQANSKNSELFLQYLEAESKEEQEQYFEQLLLSLPEGEQTRIRRLRERKLDSKL